MSPTNAAVQILETVGAEPATVWLSFVGGEVSAWTFGARPGAAWVCLRRKVHQGSYVADLAVKIARAAAKAGDE